MVNYEHICFLNSNDGTGLLALGLASEIILDSEQSLEDLQQFLTENKGKFVFGYLAYDLKNKIENLESRYKDVLEFPTAHFWIPSYVIHLDKEKFIYLQGEQDEASFTFLDQFMEEEIDHNFHSFSHEFKARTTKKRYLAQIEKIKTHIQRGDIYEINYCQEYFAENVHLEYPLDAYFKLNHITKAPFSTFLKTEKHILLCGSPERYLKKSGSTLISQPIKGTAPRGSDKEADEIMKKSLENDPKERAENIMIVDLVRNDLSRVAQKGSVQVSELCGIHTFETVHQLISTITCELKPGTTFTDIIQASFPMGSMTGAPKIEAMKIIDDMEDFNRGIYSGSIGYISPNGDFDFNVVIRSLIYNRQNKYLSCAVGSAITMLSDPEKEYDECQIKIEKILNGMHAE